MKRISLSSLLLVTLFLSSASAGEKPNISFYEEESQTRQLAEQMLTGSKVVVRVYDNYQADPRAYKLVSVPLAGLSVSHNAVKEAYPDINKLDIIVIVARDQLDKIVAAVINDFVYADTYDPKKSQSIWPDWSRILDYKYLVFTDALGEPIPQAKVKVLFYKLNGLRMPDIEIHFDERVLDKQGRLKLLILGNSAFRFEFIVSHPRYGKAIVASYYYDRQSDGRIVLPLVSADSEAAKRATTGYVVDTQGNALEAMPVECKFHTAGIDNPPRAYRAARGRAITDEQGWFSVYIPLEKNGVLSAEIVPPAAQFHLYINPPKSSNLHEYDNPGVVVGSELMITMTAMNPDEHFHTFTFMDGQDIITDPEELRKINMTFSRSASRRLWRILKYDDFKDGCDLPEGWLDAHTTRWDKKFSFKPIQLTSESTEELVFIAGEQLIYEGTVVEGKTGKPMPDVLVLVKPYYPREGFSGLTDQQLQSLRARALSSYNEVPSGKELYECDDRVTITDENGRYQFVFKTGLGERLDYFVALEKGYVAEDPVYGRFHRLTADGIAELPAIKLLPSKYCPVFVFEDEFGNIITDPNIFKQIRLKIERYDGSRGSTSYGNLINIDQFKRGTYHATLDWQDLRYVYEPVEVTWDSPQTILFKLQEVISSEIISSEIIYQGRVIHGITGAPMPGAIVMNQGSVYDRLDASDIQPEQWNAIRSLGPKLDPNDPALIPLRETFEFTKITRADEAGQFKLTLERKVTSPMGSSIIAVEEDYLGAQQQLRYSVPIDRNSSEPIRYKEFEPDADGYVKLPSMKLYPAATVTLEPNLPYARGPKEGIRFYSHTLPNDPTPWLKDFWATPKSAKGASVLRKYDLKPNEFQTIHVLAGPELIFIINPMLPKWALVTIRGIKLKQGQFLDLGRQDFQQTFGVTVKVINSAGISVKGVTVECRDADGRFWGSSRGHRPVTDKNGKAILYVPPYSNGEFLVFCSDRLSGKRLQEGIPYKVADKKEDAGRVFSLQLSDEILSRMYEQNLFRQRSP